MGPARRTLAILLGLALLGASAGAPAGRVVSLNPSLTAILLALDARDVLVGVDSYSHQQNPEIAGLPTVGGLYNPSLEALVALEPDLVVLVPSAEQRDFRRRLAELGVAVQRFDPLRFDEVLESITRLGRLVGHEEAARRRVREIEARRDALRARHDGEERVRAVLVLQREPLFVVGGGNFIHEMLESVGARNVAADLGGTAYPRVSLEWLVAAAPEVILDSSGDPTPPRTYWAQWPSLPAVASGRVVRLPVGTATLPGPWLDRALALLARSVHGADATADGDAPAAGGAR